MSKFVELDVKAFSDMDGMEMGTTKCLINMDNINCLTVNEDMSGNPAYLCSMPDSEYELTEDSFYRLRELINSNYGILK